MLFNTIFSTIGVFIAYLGLVLIQDAISVALIVIGLTLFIVFSVAPFMGPTCREIGNNKRVM